MLPGDGLGAGVLGFARVLRAIIFDFDGTLVASEALVQDAIASTLLTLGVTITPEQRQFIIGHAWQAIWDKIAHEQGLTMALNDFIELYLPEYRRLSEAHVKLLPGAAELVARTRGRYALTIVSGSSRREIAMVLDVVGWHDAFPWYLGSDDYTSGKPDPEPFQRALTRLGVAPEEALVLEDSSAGIAAARAAGIRVIAVRAGNSSGQDQTAADLVVDTLSDVSDALLAGF